MATAASPSSSTTPPMNVISRFIGIITAPRATFANVVAHPRWLVMYLLTATIIAVGAAVPMTTEAGRQSVLDQQVSSMESFGMEVNDEMYEQLRRRTQFAAYTTGASVLIGSLVMALILAGILWAIFNAAMGGDATYKQILAILVHASVISALGQVFTAPINYFRGAVTSATSLSALMPIFDEQSFVGRLAGMLDLFVIWWLIVLAIGLAVLYRRRTQPIAFALFGIYAVIIVAIAAFMSS